MEPSRITRGFRRLSVLVGFIGLIAGFVFVAIKAQNLSDVHPVGWLVVLALFVVAPVIITLLAGWVVAGFRSN
jgi:Na+/serine symporter